MTDPVVAWVTTNPWAPWALLFLGMLAHYIKKLAETSLTAGAPVSFTSYFLQRPWRSVLMLLGTCGALLAAQMADAVNPLTALLMGYAGDSIFGNRSETA